MPQQEKRVSKEFTGCEDPSYTGEQPFYRETKKLFQLCTHEQTEATCIQHTLRVVVLLLRQLRHAQRVDRSHQS